MRSCVLVSFLHSYLSLLDFFFSTHITVLWMLSCDAVLCICCVVGAMWRVLCGDVVWWCCVVDAIDDAVICLSRPSSSSCTPGLKLGPCYLLAVTLDIVCLDIQYHPPLSWAVNVLSRLHLPFRQPDLCCRSPSLVSCTSSHFMSQFLNLAQSRIFPELKCPGKLLTPPDLSGQVWASFVEPVKKHVFKSRNPCRRPERESFSSEKVTTVGVRAKGEKRWVSFGQWKPQYVGVSFSLASLPAPPGRNQSHFSSEEKGQMKPQVSEVNISTHICHCWQDFEIHVRQPVICAA